MDSYRLYFMSSDGDHIDRFEPIEARDDKDAMRFGEIYIGARPLELWLGSRKVVAYDRRSDRAEDERMAIGQPLHRTFAPLLEPL